MASSKTFSATAVRTDNADTEDRDGVGRIVENEIGNA
jgi:hypothetical protein